MKCSCEFDLWMLSYLPLLAWSGLPLSLRNFLYPETRIKSVFRSDKAGQKRRILVCFLISVGTVLKECVSPLSLYLQVCGSFQISQGTGG